MSYIDIMRRLDSGDPNLVIVPEDAREAAYLHTHLSKGKSSQELATMPQLEKLARAIRAAFKLYGPSLTLFPSAQEYSRLFAALVPEYSALPNPLRHAAEKFDYLHTGLSSFVVAWLEDSFEKDPHASPESQVQAWREYGTPMLDNYCDQVTLTAERLLDEFEPSALERLKLLREWTQGKIATALESEAFLFHGPLDGAYSNFYFDSRLRTYVALLRLAEPERALTADVTRVPRVLDLLDRDYTLSKRAFAKADQENPPKAVLETAYRLHKDASKDEVYSSAEAALTAAFTL